MKKVYYTMNDVPIGTEMIVKKSNEKRTETIMYISLQIAASLSVLSHPFLPYLGQFQFYLCTGGK